MCKRSKRINVFYKNLFVFNLVHSFPSNVASGLILIAYESVDLKSETIVTGIFYGIAPQPESRLIDTASSSTTERLAARQWSPKTGTGKRVTIDYIGEPKSQPAHLPGNYQPTSFRPEPPTWVASACKGSLEQTAP